MWPWKAKVAGPPSARISHVKLRNLEDPNLPSIQQVLYINQSYVRGSDLFSSSFDLCNILFTNHVSRMKERNIFQKIIGTSHIGLINKQYCNVLSLFQCCMCSSAGAGVDSAKTNQTSMAKEENPEDPLLAATSPSPRGAATLPFY